VVSICLTFVRYVSPTGKGSGNLNQSVYVSRNEACDVGNEEHQELDGAFNMLAGNLRIIICCAWELRTLVTL